MRRYRPLTQHIGALARRISFFPAAVLLLSGCSGAPAPSAAPATLAPTPDVNATVAALVQATLNAQPTVAPATTPAPAAAILPAPAFASPSVISAPTVTGEELADALAASGLPVSDVVVYTDETDVNHLLGRPGQYVAKINWTDTRVPQQVQEATIEAFADMPSMENRFKYLDTIIKSAAIFNQWMYRNDAVRLLLRAPHELTPSQAKDYETWLAGLGPNLDTPTTQARPAAPSPPAATAQPIALNGTDGQNTEPFQLAQGSYTIDWKATSPSGAFLGLDLKPVSGGASQSIANTTLDAGATKSGQIHAYQLKAGSYYVAVIFQGDWSVTLTPMP